MQTFGEYWKGLLKSVREGSGRRSGPITDDYWVKHIATTEANMEAIEADYQRFTEQALEREGNMLLDLEYCDECGNKDVQVIVSNEEEVKMRACTGCDYEWNRTYFGCEKCARPAYIATVLYDRGERNGHPSRGTEYNFCADCGHMTEHGWGDIRWSCTVPEQMFASYWMERDGVSPKDVERDLAYAEETGKEEDMKQATLYERISAQARKSYAECDCGHENAMGVVHWDQDSFEAFHKDEIESKAIHAAFMHIYHNFEQPLPVGFTKVAICCGKRTPGTIPLEDLKTYTSEEE